VSELTGIGDRLLVIFDGHCGYCNRAVRWFLRRDRHDRLRFAPSQSPRVAEFLTRHRITETDQGLGSSTIAPSTILVVRHSEGTLHLDRTEEEVLVRSDAALAMLAVLPNPWPAVAAMMRWIPRPLRDLAYRLVARFRYRLWGRLEVCPIPTDAECAKFL
jgi:predicted DCC family thiol-disulfide oxidoreductase YuxK